MDSTPVCRRALGCEWGGENGLKALNPVLDSLQTHVAGAYPAHIAQTHVALISTHSSRLGLGFG